MTEVEEARARSLAPSCQLREQQPRNQKRPSGTDRVLSISQTLNSISAEKNSTIIFPLPIDFISHFLNRGKGGNGGGGGGGQSGLSSPTSTAASAKKMKGGAGTPPEIAVKED